MDISSQVRLRQRFHRGRRRAVGTLDDYRIVEVSGISDRPKCPICQQCSTLTGNYRRLHFEWANVFNSDPDVSIRVLGLDGYDTVIANVGEDRTLRCSAIGKLVLFSSLLDYHVHQKPRNFSKFSFIGIRYDHWSTHRKCTVYLGPPNYR